MSREGIKKGKSVKRGAATTRFQFADASRESFPVEMTSNSLTAVPSVELVRVADDRVLPLYG